MQRLTSSGGGSAYRSKRSQYATKACDECRRRKVKCDGQEPCERCSGQHFECSYDASSCEPPHGKRRKQTSAKIQGLDGSVRTPAASMLPSTAQRASAHQNLGSRHPPAPAPSEAVEFFGPSSTEFTLNVATSNMHGAGPTLDVLSRRNLSGSSSTHFAQYGPFMKLLTMDPLWDFHKQEAIALVEDWCFGLGDVYPIVDRQKLLDIVNNVFNSLELADDEGLKEQGGRVAESLFNHNTNKLKIVLAIGITKETGGRDHRAERLFQSTSEAVEGLLWNPEGIHGVQLLFLAAMYHYHLNEEVRTGRTIAFAARLCLEMGFHRRNNIERSFPEQQHRIEALQAFWAVYTLERRLSLGQGIPFTIQDSIVDTSLQMLNHTSSILNFLLVWTRLAGKIWYALNSYGVKSPESTIEDVTQLDHEILQWYDELPEHWKLASVTTRPSGDEKTRYYQSVLFVRKSHLRCLIYRPILQSPAYISQNKQLFMTGINITKDTIRTLVCFHENTALIRTHPLFFQQLLLTAFGNLLLAIVNAQFGAWGGVRTEFDMVLSLFKDLASDCAALRRTWRRLQGLRDLPKKLAQPQRGHTIAPKSGAADASRAPEAGLSSIAALSFEDIFPKFPSFTQQDSTQSFWPESNAKLGTQTMGQSGSSLMTDHLELDNFFDFPFLDLDIFYADAAN